MSNSITLNKIELDGQKIIYNFSIPSEIREHINPDYINSQDNGTLEFFLCLDKFIAKR